MEKYGFVYIWYDKKRKMYYIGSHWGTEDDGYICSSNRMRKAYRRRPQDFKRRLLERIDERSKLMIIENKWLQKAEKKKDRYYNLRFMSYINSWWTDEEKILTVGQKISRTNKTNPKFGKWNIGRRPSEEVRQKISESTSVAMKQHYKENPRTEETRKKISENTKRLQREGKVGMIGKKHSEETKNKMRNNNAMKNPIYVDRVRDSKRGIAYLNKDGRRKMAVPNTEKWNKLISQGYESGY